jgi:aerobic-type carbon monoxide dehydrogenase small subunit (CoxS/CutS family)
MVAGARPLYAYVYSQAWWWVGGGACGFCFSGRLLDRDDVLQRAAN